MPYVQTDPNQWGEYIAVGFLKLPNDVFQADSTATAPLPPSPAQPGHFPGYGSHPWWDPSAKRWLPVALSAVGPDQKTYAYSSGDGLHLVVITPTADRLLYPYPTGVEGAQVLAYLAAGVYVDVPTAIKTGGGGSYSNPVDQVGVWRVDATSGAATRILPTDVGGSLQGGALWSVQVLAAGETLVRTDLSSGQQANWFTDLGRSMQFLGVDHAGYPIVWTFANGHLEIWHVTAPDKAVSFDALDYAGNAPIYPPEITEGPLIGDDNGVWFGATDGLYIYDATGFHKVAATPGFPAGPCT